MTKSNIELIDNMNAIEYDRAFEMVKEEIDKALSSAPLIMRKYTWLLRATTGKFIRASALLSCAENREGLINPDAVKMAGAIELFHLATLVHDDVIDNANIRRGEITLQKKYGKRTAVICGDYIFCIALKLASGVTNKEEYANLDMPDYIGRVCLGELSQHVHNGYLDLSIHQYLKIISGKTAALFEASFYTGAILNGENEQVISRYKRLGRNIGMIFQITDDCMDFETSEHVAKKPIQSDFEQGVITLPLIYALKNIESFKEKAKNGKITRSEINNAVKMSKGLEHARKLSKKYYDKSLQIINELDLTEGKKTRLMSILDRAYRVF